MKRRLTIIFMVVMLMGSSCASNKSTRHKKLKPGKPIPCPVKDC